MNLKSIFYLHRSDRKVLLLLLLFIVGSIGLIIFVGNQTTETIAVKTDSISKNKPTSFSRKAQIPEVETTEGKHLFPFDPNTATAEELQQLGLAPFKCVISSSIVLKEESIAHRWTLPASMVLHANSIER